LNKEENTLWALLRTDSTLPSNLTAENTSHAACKPLAQDERIGSHLWGVALRQPLPHNWRSHLDLFSQKFRYPANWSLAS